MKTNINISDKGDCAEKDEGVPNEVMLAENVTFKNYQRYSPILKTQSVKCWKLTQI